VAALRTQLEVARAHPAGADWEELSGDLLEDTLGMEGLVKDLLLLARTDNGASLRHEPVDLAALVLEVAPDVQVDGQLTVMGDRDALARLVRNLTDNARRHARSRVEVFLSDGRLTVSDDGPGVPPELRNRIFDRFFQADPARSRQVVGAGLGLAIARSIAERHGGSLSLADTSRLGGADFVLTLS
jgi:signal transduction histidine kinase